MKCYAIATRISQNHGMGLYSELWCVSPTDLNGKKYNPVFIKKEDAVAFLDESLDGYDNPFLKIIELDLV